MDCRLCGAKPPSLMELLHTVDTQRAQLEAVAAVYAAVTKDAFHVEVMRTQTSYTVGDRVKARYSGKLGIVVGTVPAGPLVRWDHEGPDDPPHVCHGSLHVELVERGR